jgi:hypothetical protein
MFLPQVMLECPRVLPLIREFEAASVRQHVRVKRERQRTRFADPGQRLAETSGRHRSLWNTCRPLRLLALREKLLITERLNRGDAVLQPRDGKADMRVE